ncbi:tetratricopeptide repeat protein [Halosquirtibacter xylanolyticus]|uniref:tetratricopeptide repeat protein n=1 Tax=Halosquirtibacter xylanolyticus TaxID=3374599 RepID=UPI00374A4519|nr:tetratricopeptide repeat protein [Prolixibacteraceae bacterium]
MMKIHKVLIGATLLVALLSCSTSKKITSSKNKANPVALKGNSSDTKLSEEMSLQFEYLFIEGLKQRMLGNFEGAIALFSKCLEIDPKSAISMYELSTIHIAKKDITSALGLLEKAYLLEPSNDTYAMLLAQVFEQRKRYDKAADIYEQLVAKHPTNLDYIYRNAALYASSNQFEEAIKMYDRLEKEMGLNERISVAKEQIYLSLKKPKKAREEIQRLIDSNPKETKYYGLMADLYMKEDNRETALKYYNKVLEIDPKDGFVHISLANYYREGKQPQKALFHVEKAMQSTTLDTGTKIQMFLLLTAPKTEFVVSDEEKEKLLGYMIAANPSESRPHALFAEYLIQKQEFKRAQEQFQYAIDLEGSNYIYWERVIMLDNQLLDWDAMKANTEKALLKFPNKPLLYIFKSLTLLQDKQYTEMLPILEKAEVLPDVNKAMLSQIYTYKAEALYNLDKFEEAWKAYDKVVELDPTNYMAMNNFAYYLSLRSEQLEKAERLSALVVEKNPNNPTYLDTYAWVLFMKKDYRLAKFYMKNAIDSMDNVNPTLYEHYGDILYFLDDIDGALNNWNKAKKEGIESEILDKKIKGKKYYSE